LERRGEGNRILDRGQRYFTSAIRPCLPFVSVPYNRADRLPCGKKGTRDDASDLTSDSHDCIHKSYFFLGSDRDD
jgi:hypothetical protein